MLKTANPAPPRSVWYPYCVNKAGSGPKRSGSVEEDLLFYHKELDLMNFYGLCWIRTIYYISETDRVIQNSDPQHRFFLYYYVLGICLPEVFSYTGYVFESPPDYYFLFSCTGAS